MFPGAAARALAVLGLQDLALPEDAPTPLVRCGGGPARWRWDLVRQALTR